MESKSKDVGNCCRAVITHAKQAKATQRHEWEKAAQAAHEMTAGAIGRMTHWHDDSNAAVINYTHAVSDILFKDADEEQGREIIRHYLDSAREIIGDEPPPMGMY